MKLALSCLLVAAVGATNLFDCDPKDFYEGLNVKSFSSRAALRAGLKSFIDEHTIIPFDSVDEANEVLDADPSGNGVTGIYSLLPQLVFPTDWNREHIWPRSRGVGDNGADTSDLFALYPASVSLNSARQNKFYDECVVGVNNCVSPAGSAAVDAAEGTTEDSDTWGPPPSVRGDLARVIFYMATRYDGSDPNTEALQVVECNSDETCPPNSFGRLSTLLRWHEEDPVSQRELERVNGICTGFQGNRNPYVDFPELVQVVFGNADLPGEKVDQGAIIAALVIIGGVVIFAVVGTLMTVKFKRGSRRRGFLDR